MVCKYKDTSGHEEAGILLISELWIHFTRWWKELGTLALISAPVVLLFIEMI